MQPHGSLVRWAFCARGSRRPSEAALPRSFDKGMADLLSDVASLNSEHGIMTFVFIMELGPTRQALESRRYYKCELPPLREKSRRQQMRGGRSGPPLQDARPPPPATPPARGGASAPSTRTRAPIVPLGSRETRVTPHGGVRHRQGPPRRGRVAALCPSCPRGNRAKLTGLTGFTHPPRTLRSSPTSGLGAPWLRPLFFRVWETCSL